MWLEWFQLISGFHSSTRKWSHEACFGGNQPMVEWFQEVWLELFPFRLGLEGLESRSIHDSWIIWTFWTCIILRKKKNVSNQIANHKNLLNSCGCESLGIGTYLVVRPKEIDAHQSEWSASISRQKETLWLCLKQFTYRVSCLHGCLEIALQTLNLHEITCDLLAEASVGLFNQTHKGTQMKATDPRSLPETPRSHTLA